MKKFYFAALGLLAALTITSCKSKESAYKAAFEKAQEQQASADPSAVTPVVEVVTPVIPTTPAETVTPATTVTPVTPVTTVTPVTPSTPSATDPTTVPVRVEAVTLVNGDGLQSYNVVCGSFGVQANAENLQNTLKAAGYPALIAINPTNNMYRVIATTHADKASAVQSRDALRAKFPDAWLLLKQ